jgi:hypothetical protein
MRERIRANARAAVMVLIAGLLLSANAHAQAPEEIESRSPNPGLIVFDLIVLRPLGLVAVVVGGAAFPPAAGLTAANGRDGIQAALQLFVIGPAKNVFLRPLGDF